jgi:hypothetical protein
VLDMRAEIARSLRRSEGFAVESAAGRFGTVEAYRDGGDGETAGVLVVRAGWRGRRRMLVSVDDVGSVRPREGVVRLRSKWMTVQA